MLRNVAEFLDNNNVSYVKKADNPTDVRQCRPTEEFFGLLVPHVHGFTTKIGLPRTFRPSRGEFGNVSRKYHPQLYKPLWRRFGKGSCEPIEMGSWKFVTDDFCLKLIV